MTTDDVEQAARLLGAANARREEIGTAASFEDELRARHTAEIRARASAASFTEGSEIGLDDLIGSRPL